MSSSRIRPSVSENPDFFLPIPEDHQLSKSGEKQL
jgi:hypothetical protein